MPLLGAVRGRGGQATVMDLVAPRSRGQWAGCFVDVGVGDHARPRRLVEFQDSRRPKNTPWEEDEEGARVVFHHMTRLRSTREELASLFKLLVP